MPFGQDMVGRWASTCQVNDVFFAKIRGYLVSIASSLKLQGNGVHSMLISWTHFKFEMWKLIYKFQILGATLR